MNPLLKVEGNELMRRGPKQSEKDFLRRFPRWQDYSLNEQGLQTVIHSTTGLRFIIVPAGRYQMGSLETEEGHNTDEVQHQVSVPSFLLCETQCTQLAWDQIGRGTGKYRHHPYLPIVAISWHECRTWCEMAGLRLPSEAEWEYACRAGTDTRFSFGDDDQQLDEYAWYNGNSGALVHRVRRKKPNAWGFYDMHGNVWEWCEDWYASYLKAPDDGTARTTEEKGLRIVRGGSYSDPAGDCRSASRGFFSQEGHDDDLGFRPACNLW